MTTTASRLERAFTKPSCSPNFERMFNAACMALGEVGDALGCDQNEGGAEPIIDAIQDLTSEITSLKAFVYECSKQGGLMVNGNQLAIRANELLGRGAVVAFVESDDTEGGAL